MLVQVIRRWFQLAGLLMVVWAASVMAQLPVPGNVTVAIFVRPGQDQSQREIAEVEQVLGAYPEAKATAVISGPEAKSASTKLPWPIVLDEQYATSGRFEVHAWPSTVVFSPKGKAVGHLAGFPLNFRNNLQAYLAFAAGKSSRAELEQQLAEFRLVQDSADQKAWRHLLLVEELLAGGRVENARGELQHAEDLAPAGEKVRLRLAREQLRLGMTKPADDLLRTFGQKSGDPAELAFLRGWAAAEMGRWEEAERELLAALAAGIRPAEGQYRLGMVYELQQQFPLAAGAFRQAYEAKTRGREPGR